MAFPIPKHGPGPPNPSPEDGFQAGWPTGPRTRPLGPHPLPGHRSEAAASAVVLWQGPQ